MITIKNTEQIKNMKEAGHIAYNLLNLLEGYVKEGITTKRLDEVAYNFITENEATPSFLNYEGYPASICVSINEYLAVEKLKVEMLYQLTLVFVKMVYMLIPLEHIL